MAFKPKRIGEQYTRDELSKLQVTNIDYVAGSPSTYIEAGEVISIVAFTNNKFSVRGAKATGANINESGLMVALNQIRDVGVAVTWYEKTMATTGGALGAPVWLTATEGQVTITNPGAGGVIVGKIQRVGVAGQVLLKPGMDSSFFRDKLTIADPGTGEAIPVTDSGNIAIVAAAAETNTLAIPSFLGQELMLNCDTVNLGGTRVVTAASVINIANNNTMTFGAAEDWILLRAISIAGVLAWRVIANEGVALSTV